MPEDGKVAIMDRKEINQAESILWL